jgi:hypothetical protein
MEKDGGEGQNESEGKEMTGRGGKGYDKDFIFIVCFDEEGGLACFSIHHQISCEIMNQPMLIQN